MGKTVSIAAISPMVPALVLGLLGTMSAKAQDAGGGLVISALPSDTVIGVSEPVTLRAVTPVAATADPRAHSLPDDIRRRADQPQPSIIVGDLAILAAIGPRGPLGLPFPAREAIRQRDAALFDRLLGRGVFDPDTDRMAEAIQTELQRMECYSGGIDGRWGSGSSRAVERWQEASKQKAGTDAGADLFRAIAQSGDMRCAAVAPPQPAVATRNNDAQPRRANANSNAGRGNRGNAGAAPPRVVEQKPAPAAQQQQTDRRINPALLGAGMYR